MIKDLRILAPLKRCTRTYPFQFLIRLLVQMTVMILILEFGSAEMFGFASDDGDTLWLIGFACSMAVLPIWSVMNINSKLWGYDALELRGNESEL